MWLEGEEGEGMEEQRRQREGGWGEGEGPLCPQQPPRSPHPAAACRTALSCPQQWGNPHRLREIIDEALQKLLESFLGLLNIHIRPPDNEVGLRGCLTGHSCGRRLTSLQCTSITIHSHTPQYVHRTQYVVHGTYVGTFVRSHQEN